MPGGLCSTEVLCCQTITSPAVAELDLHCAACYPEDRMAASGPARVSLALIDGSCS